MPRRPSRCYRYFDTPPYTRKEYIRGVPQPKIQIFDMGSKNKEFPIYLTLVYLEQGNITHNALEALRIAANRFFGFSPAESNKECCRTYSSCF
ncbi:MAG: ribosomal protein L16 [Candidatus Asgardarchaeia archaeon]